MDSYRTTARAADVQPAAKAPASCPSCQSLSIVTTAKSPDADSYWRCIACGDVWNDSRRQVARDRGRKWW
jgi:predicted Zn finger-like uncharacterized protein